MSTLGHVNLWTCVFTCTPQGYRKDTGRIPEGYRKSNRHPLSDTLTDASSDPLTDASSDPPWSR